MSNKKYFCIIIRCSLQKNGLINISRIYGIKERQFQNVSRLQRDSRSRKAIRLRRINHRNTCSISRIAIKVSADASLRVTKVPKFESDADIGQISADFERERFEIGSREEKQCIYKSYNTFG
ncbi:MAG: hypothetical protein JRI92_02440 [Deltaproteobacteria bacterium]|nr:hypothetical protein [Deltaproteobacteria bacterium]